MKGLSLLTLLPPQLFWGAEDDGSDFYFEGELKDAEVRGRKLTAIELEEKLK